VFALKLQFVLKKENVNFTDENKADKQIQEAQIWMNKKQTADIQVSNNTDCLSMVLCICIFYNNRSEVNNVYQSF
jgi:hypothetical protein